MAYARRIWEMAAFEAGAGPARDMTAPRAYLSARRCWPTYEDAPILPKCVRWLAGPSDGLARLPAGAVGALVWAFEHGDELRAVQLEALGEDGGRLDAWPTLDRPAKRKTHGRTAAAWLKLPRPGAHTLVLVEGPVDALAAHWLHPSATVWCCGIRVEIGERGRGDVADALATHISEVYEERTAIMEYDGELPREKAEAEAIRIAWKGAASSARRAG